MNAAFYCTVKYGITGKCLSPLRTGGTNGNVSEVLCDQNGIPMIQGSSIAGSIRNWLEKNRKKNEAEKLFGNIDHGGQIIFTDGIFEDTARIQIRPRLAIDGTRGVAKRNAKFDVAHVGVGACFHFSLYWMGSPYDKENDCSVLENALSALNCGEIRLGGQKSNGFGRVLLTVTRADYDMTNSDDMKAWVDESKPGISVSLERNIPRKDVVRFTVTGTTEHLLVKAGYSDHALKGKNDINIEEEYLVDGKSGKRRIIPASSIKGAVRARATSISEFFPQVSQEMLDGAFGRLANRNAGQELDNGKAGQVYFSDANLEDNTDTFAKKQPRLRIGRVTSGAAPGALFYQTPLRSNSVKFTIAVPRKQQEICALILYALRDLGMGLYTLGSGYAVGRGYINVNTIEIATTNGKAAKIVFEDGMPQMDGSSKELIDSILQCLEVAQRV